MWWILYVFNNSAMCVYENTVTNICPWHTIVRFWYGEEGIVSYIGTEIVSNIDRSACAHEFLFLFIFWIRFYSSFDHSNRLTLSYHQIIYGPSTQLALYTLYRFLWFVPFYFTIWPTPCSELSKIAIQHT